MPDKYENVRSIPLSAVLQLLGISPEDYKKRGNGEVSGPCPIHAPKQNKTSFCFNDSTGTFICHSASCGAKGKGAIDLVMLVKSCNFTEAVAILSDLPRAPIQPAEQPLIEAPIQNEPFKGSYEKFYKPHPWLEKRIPDAALLEKMGVGYYHNPSRKSAYNGKVMLRLRRFSDGETVGYLARTIEPKEGEPKYILPKGFHKSIELYGAWELRSGNEHRLPLKLVYLVESPFACLKLATFGLAGLSPFGWSLSSEQVSILTQICKGVVYVPDSNVSETNRSATVQALSRRLWVYAPPLPEGISDPEQLSLEQIREL